MMALESSCLNTGTHGLVEVGDGKQRKGSETQDTITENNPKAATDAGDEAKKTAVRKRKWGSKTSKAAKVNRKSSSMEISSDSLKGLIGEVKLTETVFDMEAEEVNTLDYEPEDDRRDVKVKRNIAQASPERQVMAQEEPEVSEDARLVEARQEEETPQPDSVDQSSPQQHQKQDEVVEEKKVIKLVKDGAKKKVKELKKVKKKAEAEDSPKEDRPLPPKPEKITATTRPVKPPLLMVEEPEMVSGNKSPARNPEDRVIRIASLVRPFTVNHLKALLKRHGELDDEHFWISDIKTHCLAAFQNKEDAVRAREALHGARWPLSSPKILIVDFASVEDVEHRKAESAGIALPPKQQENLNNQKKRKEEEERERRQRAREEREKEERAARDLERQKRREAERKNPVREWDRDKIKQTSRSRSRSKGPERPARSRSRSREHRKRRGSREKKEDEKRKEKRRETKAEEEPPAKLLDDLFRKTKATPCIYWLPLTEEQAEKRAVKRQEQEKERQKREAAQREREREEQKQAVKACQMEGS